MSADNIDFMHRYARNYCGRQSTSCHGTTVQIVQPRLNLPLLGQSHSTAGSSTALSCAGELENWTGSLSVVAPSSGELENSTGSLSVVAPSSGELENSTGALSVVASRTIVLLKSSDLHFCAIYSPFYSIKLSTKTLNLVKYKK